MLHIFLFTQFCVVGAISVSCNSPTHLIFVSDIQQKPPAKKKAVQRFQLHMGVSKNRGIPKWMVKIMDIPMKIHDLGVSLFLETPIWAKYMMNSHQNKKTLRIHKVGGTKFFVEKKPDFDILKNLYTLADTNSKSPWKWMVERCISFWVSACFQRRTAVSFRECTNRWVDLEKEGAFLATLGIQSPNVRWWLGYIIRSSPEPNVAKQRREETWTFPRHQSSYSQLMSKECPITNLKRKVFRFHYHHYHPQFRWADRIPRVWFPQIEIEFQDGSMKPFSVSGFADRIPRVKSWDQFENWGHLEPFGEASFWKAWSGVRRFVIEDLTWIISHFGEKSKTAKLVIYRDFRCPLHFGVYFWYVGVICHDPPEICSYWVYQLAIPGESTLTRKKMDVCKNRGKTPKMHGENNGKPY